MFCPKCGQPQVSDETRFCVRCGFQLDGVKELIATEGLQILQPTDDNKVSKWNKPGVKTGAKIMFLSLILTPLFFSLVFIEKEFLIAMLIPKTLFLVGLFWMLYARIFGESPIQSKKTNTQTISATNAPANLFAQTETPKALPAQSINTAEMISPQSVTEHTTKLLETK